MVGVVMMVMMRMVVVAVARMYGHDCSRRSAGRALNNRCGEVMSAP